MSIAAGSTDSSYDVIVLGAGSTGENVADYATRGGVSVVMVERELVGGECSYYACMPSKALLRGGEALAAARAVDGAAGAVTGALDPAETFARRDGFTSHWDDSSQVQWALGAGIAVVRGSGRIVGERVVEVTAADGSTTTLTARLAVVVATGSSPALPPIDGLAAAAPWTSRDATSAQQVPASLAVIGGGVVGVEMATAWRALGAEVTIIERSGGLLAGQEPFVGALVADALRGTGVEVRLDAAITGVRRDGGTTTVALDGADDVRAEVLLVAAGRRSNTADIGLEGVLPGHEAGKPLEVDASGLVAQVGGGWLWAAGDVTGRRLLTHMGKYEGRATGRALAAKAAGGHVSLTAWARTAATADDAATPGVVFTDPQIGYVGLTEAKARAAGRAVRTAEYDLAQVAGASLYADGYTGRAKLVIDDERDVIIGATFVGPGVGELLHAATIAIVGEVSIDRLWHAVPSYPTISEVWLRLLETDAH